MWSPGVGNSKDDPSYSPEPPDPPDPKPSYPYFGNGHDMHAFSVTGAHFIENTPNFNRKKCGIYNVLRFQSKTENIFGVHRRFGELALAGGGARLQQQHCHDKRLDRADR